MFSWDTVNLIHIQCDYKFKLDLLYQAYSDMYQYGCESLNALKLLMRMFNLMQENLHKYIMSNLIHRDLLYVVLAINLQYTNIFFSDLSYLLHVP